MRPEHLHNKQFIALFDLSVQRRVHIAQKIAWVMLMLGVVVAIVKLLFQRDTLSRDGTQATTWIARLLARFARSVDD